MPVIPLLPLFHRFNSKYFEKSLTVNNQPLVKVRWSDNKLKTTAGFYKRKRINGFLDSEIILSKPILSKLSNSEINSTLCHEMIHAWVDRILNKNEIHGPNFLEKMHEINAKEKNFQIAVRHSFPIERRELKYIGTCQNCGEKFFYRKRIKNIACKKCCINFFNGSWNKKHNNLWIQGELEILEIILIETLLINKLIKFLKLEDNSLMEYLVLGQVKEGIQIFKE